MDIYQGVAVIAVAAMMIFLFLRNKKAAQKEINGLSEIEYGSHSAVTFDDVAGNDEAKENLSEVADFIRCPEKYERFNARMPRGVLLYGSPGTGKTLLARALAGEADVPFYAVSGSDFVQVYAGLGASRIRALFKKARKAGKSVIFIDEIDAIGKKRAEGGMRGSDEGDRTLNALLTEMSGFDGADGIVVVAATNRADMLDSALTRPGRFDRQIEVMLPDKRARKEILNLYLSGRSISESVNVDRLSEMTVYFSGAMLENLVNEAAIAAVRDRAESIHMHHIENAYLSILAGPELKNRPDNMEQKRVTSYHEAGHAFMSKYLMPENEIMRVSIIPTAKGAGGYTLSTPDGAEVITRGRIKNQIRVLLAGRACEEVFFGKDNISVGAVNDIQRTTALAADYAAKYGMDDEVGLIDAEQLGRRFGLSLNFVEKSVKHLIDELYTETVSIIEKDRKKVDMTAKKLMDKEVISGKDVEI